MEIDDVVTAGDGVGLAALGQADGGDGCIVFVAIEHGLEVERHWYVRHVGLEFHRGIGGLDGDFVVLEEVGQVVRYVDVVDAGIDHGREAAGDLRNVHFALCGTTTAEADVETQFDVLSGAHIEGLGGGEGETSAHRDDFVAQAERAAVDFAFFSLQVELVHADGAEVVGGDAGAAVVVDGVGATVGTHRAV